jgi:osmoprotectant transport system substrate-binding protein
VTPRRSIAVIAFAALLCALGSCGRTSDGGGAEDALGDDAVTVGSFNFAESELLEDAGFTVERAFRLGPRELVSPALAAGLVEFVPEYAGTALQFLSLETVELSADARTTHDALVSAAAKHGLVALSAAPAQNANAFVATREVADRLGLVALSDLAGVAEQLTFGGPPECRTRPLCLLGLRDRYGLSFGTIVALDAGGAMTHQAIDERYVDVALVFTTDPRIDGGDFVLLDDDRQLQPAENITPLVRAEVVERWGPRFVDVVDAVSREVTTGGLRELNASMGIDGARASDVAASWLERQGLR